VLTGCTFYGNGAGDGGAIYAESDDNFELTNCIIAFSTEGGAVYCGGDAPLVSCSDIYGNVGRDWVDCLAGMDAMNNNLHADPFFFGLPRIVRIFMCSPLKPWW
jgi:predicted outer membrane repeat protein